MKNIRIRNNVKLVSNEKYCLKWTSNPSYMSNKIFDKDLVAIRKSKVISILNKPAHVEMMLDLSKVLLVDFH